MNVVSTDTSCIVCGYNLRTLSREGVCPECGAAVERSFQGDLLRFADQKWLRRVHLGMTITRWSTRVLYGAVIVVVCGLVPLLMLEFLDWQMFTSVIGGLVFLPCGFVAILWPPAMAVGLWMISTHEPRGGTGGGVRVFLFRWLSILVIPSIAVWFLVLTPRDRFQTLDPFVFLALQCASVALIAAHAVLLVDFTQELGRRSASFDEKTAAYLRRVRTQVIGCSIVFAVVCLPSEFAKPMDRTPIVVLIFTIIWLAAHGNVAKVVECVRREREAAGAAGLVGERSDAG